jgi:ABC-type Mn2+/Zn2+ transport system permease subunit
MGDGSWFATLAETFAADFMRRALLEAVLVGVVCGAVGVHVLLRRLPFFTLALGHATFPGVVLASLIGIDVLLGAGAFGIVVVLAVVLLGAAGRGDAAGRSIDPTSAIGVALAGTFAVGVLLVSTRSGFSKDLAGYLVGSIVTVQPRHVLTTAVVGVVVLAALAALHKELVLGAFDRTALVAQGYPAFALDLAFLLLLEVTVVTSVPAVGTILPVALIAAPAAAARLWSDRIGVCMALAAAIGAGSGVAGLAVSTLWRVAAGPSIVLVATAVFLVSLVAAPRNGVLGRRLSVRAAASPST